jgi:hypothetical protein
MCRRASFIPTPRHGAVLQEAEAAQGHQLTPGPTRAPAEQEGTALALGWVYGCDMPVQGGAAATGRRPEARGERAAVPSLEEIYGAVTPGLGAPTQALEPLGQRPGTPGETRAGGVEQSETQRRKEEGGWVRL